MHHHQVHASQPERQLEPGAHMQKAASRPPIQAHHLRCRLMTAHMQKVAMRCAISGSTTRSSGRWAGQMSPDSMPGLTPAPCMDRCEGDTAMGMAWHGIARHGTAWLGLAWQRARVAPAPAGRWKRSREELRHEHERHGMPCHEAPKQHVSPWHGMRHEPSRLPGTCSWQSKVTGDRHVQFMCVCRRLRCWDARSHDMAGTKRFHNVSSMPDLAQSV